MRLTRETSGLRIEVDRKGNLQLFVGDVKVPHQAIVVDGGSHHELGMVRVDIPAMFVTFVSESQPANDAPPPNEDHQKSQADFNKRFVQALKSVKNRGLL